MAMADDPSTLDWNKATDGISFEVITNLMDGLTRFNKHLNVSPDIALSWESVGNKEFVFHLDPSRTWSDGKTVTSSDFRNSFLRLLSPKTASPYAYYLFDIQNASCFHQNKCTASEVGIKVPDPKTLQVTLSHPMAAFPSLLTSPITDPVRIDLIQKYKDKWTSPEHLVTNGRFTLKDWWHGDSLLLESRKDIAPKPSLNRIRFLIIPEPVTQLLLYDRHVLDIVGVPSFYVKKYQDSPDLHRIPQFSTVYYSLNVKRPPFDNIHVRKAFALAVDRSDLRELFQNAFPISRSFIPRGLLGYEKNGGYHYDPQTARAELAKAGYPDGKHFPRVTLIFPSGTQSRILAVHFQESFRKVLHVSIHLRSLEWKAFLAKLDSKTPQMYQSGWLADYPDPNTFMTLMMTDSGNNRTGWGDPLFDHLVSQALSSDNQAVRSELYKKAQKQLLRIGIPVIPLSEGLSNMLVHQNIKGFWHDPLGTDHLENVTKTPD
ncbi:MAG: peptide ABC transporter substrate-binding protein [Leptospirillum sp.]|jgi:oligopeptide transport system substrate-binding protein